MISEQIEFQISQYVDDTLSEAERAEVDELLGREPQARRLLADYRKLNDHLASHNSGPSVHWDRLSEHLSAGIDRATAPVIAGRISRWSSFAMPMRIAAAILIACTVWITVRHRGQPTVIPTPQPPASTSDVQGPAPEVASGAGVEEVEVKPSQMAARSEAPRYGEGVIDQGPSKVVISGLTTPAKKSSQLR